MARKNIDRSKVPAEMLAKAREAALAKQARIMAEQELGISDTDLPVQKGPPLEAQNDELVDVYLNMADFQSSIILDNVHYVPGRSYKVPQRVADVFHETMARGWRHQAEIEGKDRSNFYLQQQVQNTARAMGSGGTGGRVPLPAAIVQKMA